MMATVRMQAPPETDELNIGTTRYPVPWWAKDRIIEIQAEHVEQAKIAGFKLAPADTGASQ